MLIKGLAIDGQKEQKKGNREIVNGKAGRQLSGITEQTEDIFTAIKKEGTWTGHSKPVTGDRWTERVTEE